jgi:hypothetical protein
LPASGEGYEELIMSRWSQKQKLGFVRRQLRKQDIREVEFVKKREASVARLAAKEEGRLEGRQEGRAEGLEKGLQTGLEKGLQAGLEKAKLQVAGIAATLLATGMQLDQVAKVTGLSIDRVNASAFGRTIPAQTTPSGPIGPQIRPSKKRGRTRKH